MVGTFGRLGQRFEPVTASTRTFFRVSAPRTITIIPDTTAKRREYEESIVQTLYLSNADLKEVIDLLRIVVDVRQITGMTAINAVSLQDTPEHIAAAARLISAIDKARPEVVIDVELLEVDRSRLREFGLQIASPGADGISGAIDVNRDGLTLQEIVERDGPQSPARVVHILLQASAALREAHEEIGLDGKFVGREYIPNDIRSL